MTDKLTNKVALITGAASGIGRASAEGMAAEGAAIMCADIDAEGAEQTALIIEQRGGTASSMKLDVSVSEEVAHAISQTKSILGNMDILFNNAGIGGGDWDTTIGINLSRVYYGLHHGARELANNGGGVIINTASVAGLVGLVSSSTPTDIGEISEGAGAYIAAKHGVSGLTKQFALMFGRQGVRVNAIAPGYIETPMTAQFREDPAANEFITSLHPIGRLGQPEEIAAAAVFLASDDASFITGVVLPVDGGYTAR